MATELGRVYFMQIKTLKQMIWAWSMDFYFRHSKKRSTFTPQILYTLLLTFSHLVW